VRPLARPPPPPPPQQQANPHEMEDSNWRPEEVLEGQIRRLNAGLSKVSNLSKMSSRGARLCARVDHGPDEALKVATLVPH